MEQLPPEVIIHYALDLDLKSLISFCQTCKYFNAVCDTEYFWREKTLRDHPYPTSTKPKKCSWKKYYQSWLQIPMMATTAPNRLLFIYHPVTFSHPDTVWKHSPCILLDKSKLEAILETLRKLLPHDRLQAPDDEIWQYCEAIKNGFLQLGHYLPTEPIH